MDSARLLTVKINDHRMASEGGIMRTVLLGQVGSKKAGTGLAEGGPGRLRSSRLVLLLCLTVLLAGSVARPVSGQSAGTLQIYVARHGQTDWNVERRIQGSTDTKLNDTGRQQAATLAERLKGIRFDAVYASTLSRSRATAELVHGAVPITSLDGLGERNFGTFQGRRVVASDSLDLRGLDLKYGPPVREAEFQRRSRAPDDSLDGGESLNQFFARVRTTIVMIRGKHRAGAILIVGHNYTNQMILRALLGLTAEQAVSIEQANDELYLIELDPGQSPRLWKLIDPKTNLGDL